METAAFNFGTTYLTSTSFNDMDSARNPVVLEWGIAQNTTCEEAKTIQTSYACVSNNSDCVPRDVGYSCRCSGGYKGNPYITDGCTGSYLFMSMIYLLLIINLVFMPFAQMKGNHFN